MRNKTLNRQAGRMSLLLTLVLVVCTRVILPTEGQDNPSQKSSGVSAVANCNAAEIWAQLKRDKMPKDVPASLSDALEEGKALPTGSDLKLCEKWCNEMAPFGQIVDAGCRCARYAGLRNKS